MIDRDFTRSETTFAQVYEAFLQAQAAREPFEAGYKIADFGIRLRFAGDALASQMMPALAHLRTDDLTQVDLTICFWDTASTDIPLPTSAWVDRAPQELGEIRVYDDARHYLFYETSRNIFRLLDREMNVAIYWITDSAELAYSESTYAVRLFLHWWLADRPIQLVHAGAVGTADGGVLITGKSGSGKSTTTLSCLDSGLLYIGDDYVLTALEPEPMAFSISNAAKLIPDNVKRFPALTPAISNMDKLDEEKALIYLHRYAPEKLIDRFPIRAILQPRITHRLDTQLSIASPIASLMALAPTTLFHMQTGGQEAFQKMTQLVKSVPNYVIEVGTDLTQIPAIIQNLLQSRGR